MGAYSGVELDSCREQAMQSHCTNEQLSQELHATKAMLGVLKADMTNKLNHSKENIPTNSRHKKMRR